MESVYPINQPIQEYKNDEQAHLLKESSRKSNSINSEPPQFFYKTSQISLTSQEIITNINMEISYSRDDDSLDFKNFEQIENNKNFYPSLPEIGEKNDVINQKMPPNSESTKSNKKSHQSAPEILTNLPRIKIPTDFEKEESGKTGYLRAKSLELIEKRSREGAVDESMLSFRDQILTSRREKQIEEIIKNDKYRQMEQINKNDKIKHSEIFNIHEYVIIQDKKEEKNYNKSLIKYVESKSHKPKCTVEILSKLALGIMEEEIFIQTGQKRLQKAEEWAAAKTPRTEELIAIVQNMLLPVSPLYERTKNIQSYQIEYMKAQNHKETTLFAIMLYESIFGLTEIKASPKEDSQLISRGINLNTYLMLWNRIETLKFKPSSEWGNFKNKKIKLCNEAIKTNLQLTCDESFKSIIDYLKEWENTDFMTKKMYDGVIKSTHECMEHRNISCFEHQWKESIDYPFKNWDLIRPIDKISHKELVDSLVENNEVVPSKIIINNSVIFEKTPNSKLSPEKFLLKIFNELYEQFGFKTPTHKSSELSLEGQIGMLLISNFENCGSYSDQMHHCIRLLKAGSKNSWTRADYYFLHRFKEFSQKYKLVEKELIYKIWINKNSVHDYSFEQLKVFSVSGDNKLNMTLSWKVASPVNDKWPCVLRISKLALGQNVKREDVKDIFNSLLNIQPSDKIQKEFLEEISLGYKFNLKLANQ